MTQTAVGFSFDLDYPDEIASAIGVLLSPEEIFELRQGRPVSLLTHSFGEMAYFFHSVVILQGPKFSLEDAESMVTAGAGACKGIKIADLSDGCELYYVFPFSLERCCAA